MPGMSSPIAKYPAGARLLSLIATEVDSKALAAKLTQAVEQLVQEATNKKGAAAGPAPPPSVPSAGGGSTAADSVKYLENVQLLAPRGKFDLGFTDDQLLLRARQANHNSAQVAWSDIEHVVLIDDVPLDQSGSKGLLALVTKRGVHIQHGKSKLQVLILQVCHTQELVIPAPPSLAAMATGPGGTVVGSSLVALCQMLGGLLPDAGEHTFKSSDSSVFASSSGKPYIQANIKAQQGWLFPLPGALLFVGKPSLFLWAGDIQELQLLRTGGGSSTFDLELGLLGGTGLPSPLELGQVPAEELPRLQDYVATQRLQTGGGGANAAAAADAQEDEEGEESEEDADFDPEAASPPEQERKRRRLEQQGGGSSSGWEPAADIEEEDEEDEEEDVESADEDEDVDSDEVSLVDSDEVREEDG